MRFNIKINKMKTAIVSILLMAAAIWRFQYLPGDLIVSMAREDRHSLQNTLFFKESPLFALIDKQQLELALTLAIKNKNDPLSLSILQSGVSVDGSEFSIPPIFTAAATENVHILDELIMKGADVNALNAYAKYSPLIVAVKLNNKEIVKKLISAGADVNLHSRFENSPLYVAQENVSSEIAKILLASGARSHKAQIPKTEADLDEQFASDKKLFLKTKVTTPRLPASKLY